MNNVPCPLYVRVGSDAKRLAPRTGRDSVRASHLTCSFTVMARRPTVAKRALPGYEARDIGLSRSLTRRIGQLVTGYAITFAGGQRAHDHEGDAVRGAGPVGIARFTADDGAGPGTAILVDEGALEYVDDLLATVLVQSGQFESRVPLDDRDLQVVVETKDLTTAGRCLHLPLDVALGEVTHPGSGLRLQRRHRNISFARPSPV